MRGRTGAVIWLVAVFQPLYLDAGLNSFSSADEEIRKKCSSFCQLPKKEDSHIVIDANSGKIESGSTRFPEGTRLQVIFVNKNPFKYAYRFNLVTTSLPESIASDFLRLIGLGPFLKISGVSSEAQPQDLRPVEGDSECDEKLRILEKSYSELKGKFAELKEDLTVREQIAKQYNEFVTQTDTESLGDSCITLCETAHSLRGNLPKLVEIAELLKRVQTFDSGVKQLKSNATGFAQNQACQRELQQEQGNQSIWQELEKEIPKLEDHSKSFLEATAELQKVQQEVKDILKIINAALASDDPFHEVYYPPTIGGAKNVNITVARKNLREKGATEKIVQIMNIQVGESPVSLSGGIGFSNVDEVEIVRQAASVKGPDGQSKLGTIFGFEKNSRFKPSAVILLNARISNWSDPLPFLRGPSLLLSVGAVVSDRAGDTKVELMSGPSLGFAGDVVLLTFAFHAAQVQELGGGFKIRDPVPDGLQDPIPTEKSFHGGFIIAATFKIR